MAFPKIKVYFYHLFVFAIVILTAFFFVYRDMKRIENNTRRLLDRCNRTDSTIALMGNRMAQQSASSAEPAPSIVVKDVEDVDEDEVEDEEAVEDVDEEDWDEDEDEDESEEDEEDEGMPDEECNEDERDVVGNILKNAGVDVPEEDARDLSTLTSEELKKCKLGELKDYLKSHKQPITGNKDKLIQLVLNLSAPSPPTPEPASENDVDEILGELEREDAERNGDEVDECVEE